MENPVNKPLSRRRFLIMSGAGATTITFASSAMGREAVNLLDPTNPLVIPQNFKPSIWFTMEANGRTTVHVIRAEIGQHIGTAYAQIVAEELELDWDRVTIDYPEIDSNTIMTYGAQITGGSYSVHEMFDWLARTAAAALLLSLLLVVHLHLLHLVFLGPAPLLRGGRRCCCGGLMFWFLACFSQIWTLISYLGWSWGAFLHRSPLVTGANGYAAQR